MSYGTSDGFGGEVDLLPVEAVDVNAFLFGMLDGQGRMSGSVDICYWGTRVPFRVDVDSMGGRESSMRDVPSGRQGGMVDTRLSHR